ncbi:MAG: dihydrofolate reductase family protein [Actinomycetales bacterium]
MATVLYSASMSLDGFIAGPGGDMHWLTPYQGPDPAVDALVGDVGALLVGRRTHDGDDPNRGTEQEGAFGGTWSGPIVVLTHRRPEAPVPHTTFVSDLHEAVLTATAAAGDKYVSILGADVARQCLEAGFVDEILVGIVPVFLGDGVRLFDVRGGRAVRLERIRLTHSEHSTNLWFRVLH